MTQPRQYSSYDRSYEAQIFNRLLFPNALSKGAKNIGRKYSVESVYEDGQVTSHYAGQYSWHGSRTNVIATRLVRKPEYFGSEHTEEDYYKVFEVFIDGTAILDCRKIYQDLGRNKHNIIREDVLEYYNIVQTADGGHKLYLRRKQINRALSTRALSNTTDLGTALVNKYN